jgi:nitrogen-specific signal transduction histidine kinase
MVNAAISNTHVDVIAAVFERLPHGISVVRLEDENDLGSFRFVDANPAASRQSGVDQTGVIGTTIRESFPEVLHTDWPEKYLQAIQTGKSVPIGEVEYPDRGVSEDSFAITAVPLGGQYVAILFENTSEHRRLERELVEKAKETARLAMLHETALAMAHHIRNALTPLGLLAEFYDGSDPEAGGQLKKMATEQGDRIAAIIDALVEMSQLGNDATTSYLPSKETSMLDMDKLIERHLAQRTKLMEHKRSGRPGLSSFAD